jgi:hypothetical protein
MIKEEFEKIIKPMFLIDDKSHRDFLMQALSGNFNNWLNEKNANDIKSNIIISQSIMLLSEIDRLLNDGIEIHPNSPLHETIKKHVLKLSKDVKSA